MFKAPFSFEGRIRRTEYALSSIMYVIAHTVLSIGAIDNLGVNLTLFLIYIPLIWLMLAQGAKRCHDRGNSGFYQLIPFYGFWMLLGDSDPGNNEYGPNPKTGLDKDNFTAKEAVTPVISSKVDTKKYLPQVHQIHFMLMSEKSALIGSGQRDTLLESIANLCPEREDGLLLIETYKEQYGKDLITELKDLSSSYSVTKENLHTFISLNIVAPDYPHKRI